MGSYTFAGCSWCGKSGMYPHRLHLTNHKKPDGTARLACCACVGHKKEDHQISMVFGMTPKPEWKTYLEVK